MFAYHLPRWTAGLRRAAALLKAFALLEDGPRGAAPTPRRGSLAQRSPLGLDRREGAPEHDRHGARAHPHRRALTHVHVRRHGALPARPAACTVPIVAPRGAGARGAAAQNARW